MADTCKCGKGNDCCRVKKAADDKKQESLFKHAAQDGHRAGKSKCNCGCSSHK